MAEKRASTSRRSRKSTAAAAARPAKRRPAAKSAQAASSTAGKLPVKKKAATQAKPAAAKPAQAKATKAKSAVMTDLVKVVEAALDEMKAVQVKVLDVRKLTDIADTLVIASGNSDRHVRSISERVVEHAKKSGFRPMGVEGQRDGEWVLVDLQDVIVHIMLPRVRELYRLESLWDVSAARRDAVTERRAVGG
ncbi:MAG TPA: ribosome silencing factor [Povalibacter sp.]|nr:ribosome silencing factor [Povalibacter sp.]